MAEQMQINSINDFDRALQNIYKTVIGEFKEAKRRAEIELALFKFELLYSVFVDKKKSEENSKWVAEFRKRRWVKCIEKAKGNDENAMVNYCDDTFD